MVDALRRHGQEPIPHAEITDAVALSGSVNLDLVRREIGSVFEVQDIASQRVGLACDPKPGESWWDVCAGAGGKSLHLADLMQQRGRIVPTDIRAQALDELRDRARRSRSSIIQSSPVTDHGSSVTLFDGVLIDAPCSGIGTWSRNPDARWRTPEKMIAEKSAVQRELLMRSADHVKPGGKLVYAVCTVTKEETTEVIESFLRDRPDFRPSTPPLPPPATPTLQLWPWEGPGDGMFISVMKRTT